MRGRGLLSVGRRLCATVWIPDAEPLALGVVRIMTLIVFYLCWSGAAWAQDPVFSQFYASPMQLNPAFTGISTAPRITVNYRSQHTSYPSAFQTFAVGFEVPLYGSPSSFGFRTMTDSQLEGLYKNTSAAVVYVYDIQITRELHARVGLSGGLLNTQLDFKDRKSVV